MATYNNNLNLCENLASILSKIPEKIWNSIIAESAMYNNLVLISNKMEYGPFAVLVLMLALNDYQLKGKAEKNYWPPLGHLLNDQIKDEITKENLLCILKPFYETERFADQKVKRLNKFLYSSLAKKIWQNNAKQVSGNFYNIWLELARVMQQRKDKETIVFAMKCLGRSLIMFGETSFEFSKIPIPVDLRIKRITKEFGFSSINNENEIRDIWAQILCIVQGKNVNINMMHLDSFLFKIASKQEHHEWQMFFSNYNIKEVGEEIFGLKRLLDT